MIGRFKRWFRRVFGNHYDDLVDISDVHEHLVDKLREWKEDFKPDDWS